MLEQSVVLVNRKFVIVLVDLLIRFYITAYDFITTTAPFFCQATFQLRLSQIRKRALIYGDVTSSIYYYPYINMNIPTSCS